MEKVIKKIEDIENPIDNIFKDNVDKKKRSIGLIHRAYLTQIKNSRKYLASTKTKSEVRGGGKKPWKQKGTGNARAGSSRSPLWKGYVSWFFSHFAWLVCNSCKCSSIITFARVCFVY